MIKKKIYADKEDRGRQISNKKNVILTTQTPRRRTDSLIKLRGTAFFFFLNL